MGTPTLAELSGWLSPNLLAEKKGHIPMSVVPREVERWAQRMSGEAACFAASSWQEEKLKSSCALLPYLQHLLACSFPERMFPTELHVRPILRTCLMAQKSWGMSWQCSAMCTVRKILFCFLDSNTQHKTPSLLIRFLLVSYKDVVWILGCSTQNLPHGWMQKTSLRISFQGMHIWNQCKTEVGLINSGVPSSPAAGWPWLGGISTFCTLKDSTIESPSPLTLKCLTQGTSSLTALTWTEQTPSLLFRPATGLGFMLFSDAKSLHFPYQSSRTEILQKHQEVPHTNKTYYGNNHINLVPCSECLEK